MCNKIVLSLFLLSVLFSVPIRSAGDSLLLAKKSGDYCNLMIAIIPYCIALVKVVHKRESQKAGLTVQEHEDRSLSMLNPTLEFGPYASYMLSYLGVMFLTQKLLWQRGVTYVDHFFKLHPHLLRSYYTYPAYILFGLFVGFVSMVTGLWVTRKYVVPYKQILQQKFDSITHSLRAFFYQ